MTNQKAVKIVLFGALGGIIASIAMYPFLFLTTSMMGLPLDDLSIARGMAISNINDNYYLNLTLGIVMHLLTGAIAGVIFAIIVSTVKKLATINLKRGITEGVIYSIIIFIVLFIPTTLGMVLPNLFDLMNQSNPTQSNFEDRQTVEQNLIPIYGFGFIAHIIFGIILGLVITLLIFKGQVIQKS
ncbi:hypothetical protein NMY3_01734 [Candidatus Nitrosocosmicus oleophilus]|jgi:uncharacterized protein DUF6789|uniref:Uncharacterized protein n=1 Tax=Candidatus Nitrosocosmicus oleophilus TaxID=1353260 RepID=A0A654LY92_9ARCH|nr:DUF6789 family protein [Candidatus Nitrosocosmicus oleophilus]ALI35937.1 hypothetical protein NMY3_01734 [Candidatus Nitrosocosmicus oleophilus]